MRILTEENKTFNIDDLDVDQPIDHRYGILDYSDTKHVDFYFIPLIFMETFNAPAVDLLIGQHRIQMPLDWSIIVADKDLGELEVMPFTSLNDREFQVLAYNPITGFRPEFPDIKIMNIYPDVTWSFPKLKFGHLLSVPLMEKGTEKTLYRGIGGPEYKRIDLPCVFCVKETTKLPEVLDITKIF